MRTSDGCVITHPITRPDVTSFDVTFIPAMMRLRCPVPPRRTARPSAPRTDLTIEQLAAQTGMSVRNIRAHQARGLLAPPEVRMRVGYYGPEHVAQLQQIRELQDEGFNLNGIKRLLEDQQGTAERLLHFKRSLAAPAQRRGPADADARRAQQALSRRPGRGSRRARAGAEARDPDAGRRRPLRGLDSRRCSSSATRSSGTASRSTARCRCSRTSSATATRCRARS